LSNNGHTRASAAKKQCRIQEMKTIRKFSVSVITQFVLYSLWKSKVTVSYETQRMKKEFLTPNLKHYSYPFLQGPRKNEKFQSE
jgi:hypothetical protein